MNKKFKNLFLIIFVLTSSFSFSFVLAISGRDLVFNFITHNIPGAGQVISTVLNLAEKFNTLKDDVEKLKKELTPSQALNIISQSVGLDPKAESFLQSIIEIGQSASSSQPKSSISSPIQPSTSLQQPSPGQLIQQFHQLESQSTQKTPTNLVKPEGISSLPINQSAGQLIQQFHQLESQSTQQTPTNLVKPEGISSLPINQSGGTISASPTVTPNTPKKEEKGSDKVSVYYCDRTTAQCLYTVVNRAVTEGSDSGYYSSLAQCQANCKKAPYVCYRYSYRYLGSGCNYGWQCVPYPSDTPCKNECSPSGTPLTGTAQQSQPQPQFQSQPQTQTQCPFQQTTQTPATPGSSSITPQPPSGWTTDPYVNIPGYQCIRQQGNCPRGSGNCLSCPRGYYKQSGACSCPCDRSKPCSCYITCCSR
jgi:hypothetical protein